MEAPTHSASNFQYDYRLARQLEQGDAQVFFLDFENCREIEVQSFSDYDNQFATVHFFDGSWKRCRKDTNYFIVRPALPFVTVALPILKLECPECPPIYCRNYKDLMSACESLIGEEGEWQEIHAWGDATYTITATQITAEAWARAGVWEGC